jgi:hypothetical protein
MSTQEFIFSNPSPDTTPIIPEKKKRNNGGGRPKSLVWGDHAIQGRKVLEGHYEATCVYCDCFWKKGSPQDLEAHFANDCSKVPADTRQFFLHHLAAKAKGNITNLSTKKRKLNDGSTQKKITEFHEIDCACVKAFVVCGIAWHVIENPFFVEFLRLYVLNTCLHQKNYFLENSYHKKLQL